MGVLHGRHAPLFGCLLRISSDNTTAPDHREPRELDRRHSPALHRHPRDANTPLPFVAQAPAR
jgi:hypothetical protein